MQNVVHRKDYVLFKWLQTPIPSTDTEEVNVEIAVEPCRASDLKASQGLRWQVKSKLQNNQHMEKKSR